MTGPRQVMMSASRDIIASGPLTVGDRDHFAGVWSFRAEPCGHPLVAVTITDDDASHTVRMTPAEATAFARAIETEAMKITVEGHA